MKMPWQKETPVVAQSSEAKKRRDEAEATLRTIYERPEIAAARKESEDAWRELAKEEQRERRDRIIPSILGQRITAFGSAIGPEGDLNVNEYQAGTFNINYPAITLENGLVLTVEHGSFKVVMK